MANRYWVGGTGTWDGTAGSKWAATSGGTTYTNIPVGGVSGDVVRFDNNSGTSAAGTVITIDNAATCLSFVVLSTFTGQIKFPANTAITVYNSVTLSDSYTTDGVPYIKLTAATSRTITTGGTIDSGSEARSFTFEITNGGSSVSTASSGVTVYVRSIIFSNSSGNNTFSFGTPSVGYVIYGDLIFNNLVTSITGTTTKTFAGTVAGGNSIQKISSPLTLNFPVTFSGTSTYQLQSNLAIGDGVSLRTITHTSGTIDLQSYTLSHYGNYTSGGSTSTRGIAGTGVYNMTRSGLATYWDCANATGFTRSGTASVQFTASTSTLTVLHGTTTGAEANAMSFFFGSSPTVVLNGTNPSWIADLGVLSGFSGTISGTLGRTIYGGFFGGSTTTQSPNPFGALTFASTSATARNINITSSSYALTFNGVGGSWQLSGTSNAPTVTLTNGTFSTNGNSLTVTTFDFTTTGTRTLNINTTLTISSTGIFKGISTGTTLNNTGTISGSGYTVDVPNLNIGNVTTTGSITIGASASPSYTINNLTAPSGGGGTITLYAGSTLNIAGNLSIDGASGSTNTLQSSTSGTQATISKSSGTIITNNLNIVDSYATGGAVWRAPTNYGNINSGNNTNWIFTPIGGGGGNFLMFF
jgi:hypothetical protein